jgi:lipopolysaccharide export system permease protein
MIIERYLTRQTLAVTFAATFILTVVAILGRFLKYLASASRGELDPGVLALLMGYRMPEFLQLILPLGLLLGILLAYGRMYAENEMTVLIACGLSRVRLLVITMVPAAVITLVVAWLSLHLTPLGMVNTATLLESQKELNEFDIMVPGIFQNISRGQRTTYSESITNNEMRNVFMHETQTRRVIVARTAIPATDEQGRRVVLFRDGSITQGVSGQEEYTVTRFKELGVRIPQRDISFDLALQEKALSTRELLESGQVSHRAELQWRVSLVLLIPVMTLLAVPLSKVNPRQGRFGKLLPAMLLYTLYFGLLLGCRDLINRGSLSPVLGMWWVHALFLALALPLYWEKLPLPATLRNWLS